jgi:hypothetical protein
LPTAQHIVAFVLIVLSAGGCSSSPRYPRVPVTGTVTLDGKSLATGDITFEPRGNLPTRASGPIQAGTFAFSQENGPVPGRYAVAIFGGPVDPEAAAKFEGDAVRVTDPIYQKIREIVPRKYNIQTTLEVEVREAGGNEFHFDLLSDAPKR